MWKNLERILPNWDVWTEMHNLVHARFPAPLPGILRSLSTDENQDLISYLSPEGAWFLFLAAIIILFYLWSDYI